MTTTLREL